MPDDNKVTGLLVEPKILVFSKQDWDTPKHIRVRSIRGFHEGVIIRHHIKSKDPRFSSTMIREIEIRALLPSNVVSSQEFPSTPRLVQENASPPTIVSSKVTISPSVAYLAPKTSIRLSISLSKEISLLNSVRLVPRFLKVDGSDDLSKDEEQFLFFFPQQLELNSSQWQDSVVIWTEQEVGHSFSFLVVFESMSAPTKRPVARPTNVNRKPQDRNITSSSDLDDALPFLKSMVYYVSRHAAIVLSKSILEDFSGGSGEYSIWLSVPLEGDQTVTIKISTSTDSVCLDLQTDFERPCGVQCQNCLRDVPEIRIVPKIVKFSSTFRQVTVQILGWQDNRILEDLQNKAITSFLVTHQVIGTGTTNNNSIVYDKDTPQVFGPSDTIVEGIKVMNKFGSITPSSPPSEGESEKPSRPPSGRTKEDLGKDRISITNVPTSESKQQFHIRLAYVNRAPVILQCTKPGVCDPTALKIDNWSQELVIVCTPDDAVGNGLGWTWQFVSSSADPDFDRLTVQIQISSTPTPSTSNGDVVVQIVIGITTTLSTIVALLLVWIFMGPQALKARKSRREQKFGKRPSAASVVGAGPNVTGAPQASFNLTAPASRSESGNLFSAGDSPPDSVSPIPRPIVMSAVVQNNFAEPLFALPPSEYYHVSDVVVVRYEIFDGSDEIQYFKGRVTGDNGNGIYVVSYIDGDFDPEVDSESMRRFEDLSRRPNVAAGSSGFSNNSMSSNSGTRGSFSHINGLRTREYQVRLVREDENQSFGLKIGWTTNERVVVTGFTPGSIAFSMLELQLGDEIVQMNGLPVPRTFDAVTQVIRSSGAVLELSLKTSGNDYDDYDDFEQEIAIERNILPQQAKNQIALS